MEVDGITREPCWTYSGPIWVSRGPCGDNDWNPTWKIREVILLSNYSCTLCIMGPKEVCAYLTLFLQLNVQTLQRRCQIPHRQVPVKAN